MFLKTWLRLCSSLRWWKNIHYAPLMISQKESPRNHPWVLPKIVASLVWVLDPKLIVNDGWFILLFARQGRDTTDWEEKNDGWFLGDSFYYSLGRAEILLIGRRKWWVIPGWFLLLYLPCLVVGSTHWAEIQTILSTFLGITQEAPMGVSWVIPSVTSLTERSVWTSNSTE